MREDGEKVIKDLGRARVQASGGGTAILAAGVCVWACGVRGKGWICGKEWRGEALLVEG